MKLTKTQPNSIDAPEKKYLFIQPSLIPLSGNGLFTAIKIYKDEIICCFKGEALTPLQAVLRAKKGNDGYFINMLDGTILDSKKTNCFAKYANDAQGFSKTNFLNNAKIALDENERVCLIATKNINEGLEIFCGYGKAYWAKHKI
jgi:uncharacterized protein